MNMPLGNACQVAAELFYFDVASDVNVSPPHKLYRFLGISSNANFRRLALSLPFNGESGTDLRTSNT